MRESNLSLPELFLIAGTRVALGVGIGMLLADRLSDGQRKGAGTALVAVGAITTIPLLMMVFGKNRNKNSEFLAAS
jgi:acyl CoA:acetate/3-ketoacid CoA transferase